MTSVLDQLTDADLDAIADRLRVRGDVAFLQLGPLTNLAGAVVPRAGTTTGRLQVAPGQTISSVWGNTLFDQSMECFANVADRSAQWTTPHEGALSWLADSSTPWAYRNGVWKGLPLGPLVSAVGPASQTDCAAATTTLLTVTLPVVAGRRYRACGYGFGTQVTNTATNYLGVVDGDGTQFRFLTNYNITANTACYGIGSFMYTPATSKTATFTYFGFSSVAALRVTANVCQLQVDDIGS